MINFRHGCVIVKDLYKSIEFYEKNFGMFLHRTDSLSKKHSEMLTGIKGSIVKYAKFQDAYGGIFEIIECNKKIGPHISLTVVNIDKLYDRLKRKVKFMSPPFSAPDSGAKVCWCVDRDLNYIELVEVPKHNSAR